ncbi:ribbon-helix-helix domain-containing protein [Shimazuella kribbensis]|nr:hypothetical protein [Shimazuella kribbensis]
MAGGKDKTRLNIILTKDLKTELEKEAEMEQRSLSNYIAYLLQNRKNIKT